jgi:hypothetical protein
MVTVRSQRRLGRPLLLTPLVASALISAAATTTTPAAYGQIVGPASRERPDVTASRAQCTASAEHQAMAHRLARAITAAIRSRFTSTDPAYNPFENVSLAVSDESRELTCWYHSARQNYSASAVKATILAALLLMAQDEQRWLTPWEQHMAWLMITQSDNAAASALWNHVGLTRLQHFLNRAKMKHTALNTWGAWGLTKITPHDETLLLRLLMSPGDVLKKRSRHYELYLMNHVISSQTWGVRAGSPTYFSWHIKNGWAPLPNLNTSPWVVNSIGCFLHKRFGYTIVVLTRDNPAPGLSYGIATIEQVAWVINRALVPGAKSVWPKSSAAELARLRPVPDEVLPRRPRSR